MSVSKRTLLSKGVMAVEAIRIGKVMAVLVVDTADMAASTPQQVLVRLNHHQVHPEPLARQITVHNTLNIMALVVRILTQLTVVTRTMWRIIINITRSKPHSNQLHREPPLQLHRVMNLRLHHLQAVPLLPLMGAITQ